MINEKKGKESMKHWKRNTGIVLGVLVLVGLYYYISLPAINIHASGFWVLVLVLLGVLLAEVLVKTAVEPGKKVGFGVLAKAKEKKSVKLVLGLFASTAGLSDWSSSVIPHCECEKVPETSGAGKQGFYRGHQRSQL